MTTFGWKRKFGSNISKEATTKFSSEERNDSKVKNHDWMSSFKRRKAMLVGNGEIRSLKLKESAITLAESGRYSDAVLKLEEAIQLMPHDAKLHEMKAQALLQLNVFFPAIKATEKAIQLNPQWWIAYQTLGRAQLGIGEIKMALISFSRAFHINPANEELWENDLKFSMKILKQRNKLNEQGGSHEENSEDEISKVILDEHGYVKEVLGSNTKSIQMNDKNVVQCRF